jgi:hypothetical protein
MSKFCMTSRNIVIIFPVPAPNSIKLKISQN